MIHRDKICIIGTGVSGLVAALEMEKAGYSPIMFEQTDRIGGRLQTYTSNGFVLDHGFQVLLTQYPNVQKYLDLNKLDIIKFLPGAKIYKDKKSYTIGDPTRNLSFLWPVLAASIGNMRDKIRILSLSHRLKSKRIEDIFHSPDNTTLDYLKNHGFSDKIIEYFFRPFFSGIFLEDSLATSSRMFEFVYKMFAEGSAAIPVSGIQEVPIQIQQNLKTTDIRLNTGVKSINNKLLSLTNGDTIACDAILVATDPSVFFPDKTQNLTWNSCYNLYFTTEERVIDKDLIGLIADSNTLANNFHYVPKSDESKNGKHLLSVTVVKPFSGNKDELVRKVMLELQKHVGIRDIEFLKLIEIRNALPTVKDMKNSPLADDIVHAEGIFLAGDYLTNPSLNGAMESGRKAAELVVRYLQTQ